MSITQYIATTVSTELHITVSDYYIEYLLQTGRAAVILDGLDELIYPSRRKDLTEVVHSFARRYPESSIIVTSRIVGYDEASLDSKIFSHMYLTDFDSERVRLYVTNWFRLNPTLDTAGQAVVAQEFLRESESVAELRANPLLLSLMCNIYRGKGYIPQNRSDLYERCATMLFDEWDRSRGIESGGPLRGDARYALQDIANWALTHPELNLGIPEPMLKKRLTEFLTATRYGSPAMAEDAAIELLRVWRGRAWILTDLGSDSLHRVYQFSHRTFLEYFAATYISRESGSPNRLWQTLEPKAVSGEWDVVAEIAIQSYNSGNAGATNEIYKTIIDSVNDITDASGLVAEALDKLRFACRHLDALAPGPKVVKDLTVIAIKLVLPTLPHFERQPDWASYENARDLAIPDTVRSVVASEEDENGDELGMYEDEDNESEDAEIEAYFRTLEETVTLLNTPLALIFNSTPVILSVASAAFDDYCHQLIAGADSTTASSALLMQLSKAQFIESSRLSVMDGERATIGNLHQLDSYKVASEHDVSREEIERLSRENFWVPIIAARYGDLGLQWLLEVAGIGAFFNSESPFDVLISSAKPCLAEDLILRYVAGNSTSGDREVLCNIGRMMRATYKEGRNLAVVEADWLTKSDTGASIVKGYFLNTPGRGPEDGYYDRYFYDDGIYAEPCEERNLDVILGAAVVLCIFAECEIWEMTDLSSDRLASLDLGPVCGLEGVYLTAFGAESIDANHLRSRTGLDLSDIELLLAWARNDVRFTYYDRSSAPRNMA